MKLARRYYVVVVANGKAGRGDTLQEAIANAKVHVDAHFCYKLYEGQNQVECVLTSPAADGKPARWQERGKGVHWWRDWWRDKKANE